MSYIIYFDNAATSRYKPCEVINAYINYIEDIGTSPGRGSYSLAIQASRMLYKCRKTISRFFGNESNNIVFTKNSTEAINLFLNGFLSKGDHVLISSYEHNAVLRPIHNLKEQGIIEYDVFSDDVLNDVSKINNYINPNTKLLVVTLASNLTGEIIYSSELGSKCHDRNISVLLDASQGGGKKLIDMSIDNIDYLAFTGHKDMFGLPGVGGLCSKRELTIKPLIQGGTGIHGEYYTNPSVYPDAYESGTLNMPAIWALKSATEFIDKNILEINTKEKELTEYLISKLENEDNLVVYKPNVNRISTVCINVLRYSSSDIVSLLDKHGICVRGGIHCAILAHQTLGTVETGAVRLSLNYTNTKDEIDEFVNVIRSIK